MTLTLPVLDSAQRVVFLVVGSEKAETLRKVLTEKFDPPFPSQLVQPRNGVKIFVVDEPAAELLDHAESRKPASHGKPAGTSHRKTGRST